MTAADIEKKLNDIGLYEVIDISYDDCTKELFLWILIDCPDLLVKNDNNRFIDALRRLCYFDICCFSKDELENFPKYELKVYNNKNTFRVESEYSPKDKIGNAMYEILKSFFKRLFEEWKII